MRKIYIIGIVASGKTTFAKRLSQRLNIPWFELDLIVHKRIGSERLKQTPEEQMEEIKGIDLRGEWIFEGVYRESYREILDMADTIIFLDTPLRKRRWRILMRFIKQNLKIERCEYKPNFEMLRLMYKWTDDFERNRETFTAMISGYHEKLVVIKNPSDLTRFDVF